MTTTSVPSSALHRRLGIPTDAQKVILFAESSHWDPNWLYTARTYYDRFVRHNLDQAITALESEPRRVYSIECMFFLRMYWDERPDQRERIRTLVNTRRLRLTSSGVTTADTIVPSTEALLRDFEVGQVWLRANGMHPEPTLAYFTDSFGCTPALPSILNAAGFTHTALTRIDGMYFIGCDIELPNNFPRPGSSAEHLLKHECSIDFIWRDDHGAEVLCHWNAFNYGQGDMLTFGGVSRVYLANYSWPNRSDRHVARRIDQFVKQLAPVSRTPYLFCPIGFDFVSPIDDLVDVLDRYNRNHYPQTGIWAVNAGLDDYFELIAPFQDQLPVVTLDPNPYWTGFYTARPTLKQQSHQLVDALVHAEMLAWLPHNHQHRSTIADKLADAWWTATTANHHDFITGTSPDDVVYSEQVPWLTDATQQVLAITSQLVLPTCHTQPHQPHSPASIDWHQDDDSINVRTQHYAVTIDRHHGTMTLTTQTKTRLAPHSNQLISYRDSGGLWRMGLEFAGGDWQQDDCAIQQSAQVNVVTHTHGLEIISSTTINGQPFTQHLWFEADSPLLRCRVIGHTAPGHSVVMRLMSNIHADHLTMDTPGGIIQRPPTRIYNPTFWPYQRFLHIHDTTAGHGLAVIQPYPGAVSYQPDGTLELIVMRNANRETAYGFIKLPANPATGFENQAYTYDYALSFTDNGDARYNHIAQIAQKLHHHDWPQPLATQPPALADALVHIDNPTVWVTAIKPASHGTGMIVRLMTAHPPQQPIQVRLLQHQMYQAHICDARERDIASLPIKNHCVTLTLTSTITTIRFVVDEKEYA